MPYPILGTPKPQFFDSSGSPLASGTLSVLDPADDTNKASYPTYDDAVALTNANSNPITLDSRGEPSSGLWGLDGEDYKLVLKDSDSNTIWTVDDINVPLRAPYYVLTADETTAGITPTNYTYPEKHILRYGTNTTPGTTDMATALQSAVNVAEVSGGVVTVPAGSYALGSTITIDSDGVIIQGDGGHLGQTTLTATHTSGPVIRIKKRSCGVRGCRITSDATRYAATVTDGHGIHVESSDEAQGVGSASSLSRNVFYDLDIRIQPDDGFHNAGGAELIDFNLVTISDCKGHGAVFDNGTLSGRSNTDLAPFNFVLSNLRCFENAGNGLILGNSCANGTLINCEALGNAWDSSVRQSHYQWDIICRTGLAIQPDLEDQQYKNTTTNSTGSTRTALSSPSGGMIIRSAGFEVQKPHFSSLVSGVVVNASVDDVAVFDPVSFAGTYGSDKAMTITAATAANPVEITTSAAHNRTTGDNVYITGVLGMTELNGNAYEVVVTAPTTFTLRDPYSEIGTDGSGFTAYSSAGTATLVMDDLVTVPQTSEQFRFRGVSAVNTGCGNMCLNQSRDADIWKDDKHYKGTLVSTSDWELNAQGDTVTIASGTAYITADKILLKGESDTTDTLATLLYAAAIEGYNGMECLLVNANAYLITLSVGATIGTRNGLNYPLGPGKSVRVSYDETTDVWMIDDDGYVIASAANIADVGNAINTAAKFIGKTVYDSTNFRYMVAQTAAAGGSWVNRDDGTVSVAPA